MTHCINQIDVEYAERLSAIEYS